MRVAEFFAGIGLVRMAMERSGHQVVWANDIDPIKLHMYSQNFGHTDAVLADIRSISGSHIPDVDIATASFPCTDVSLAGLRLGLVGTQSGMLWEFTRILGEMGTRRPRAVLLENVPSFATSNSGQDLREAISILNDLGYWCDVFIVDARYFVPQSRPRLFIVGWIHALGFNVNLESTTVRPRWLQKFVRKNQDLALNTVPLPALPVRNVNLNECIESLDGDDPKWWTTDRVAKFLDGLGPLHKARLSSLEESSITTWATAYRRTRAGKAVWEIRADGISGCLRAVRGGSSKQAVIEAGNGSFRIRWMTRREYASLQGAPDYSTEGVSEAQALFGFGDAVCVPAIEWIEEHYLRPLFNHRLEAWSQARQMQLVDVEAVYAKS